MIIGAVLGSPISHSLSPLLHSTAFKILGIAGQYSAIEVKSGELGSFIAKSGPSFDYFSLTMPLKEEVLDLSIKADELSQRIQSGNTLIRSQTDWKLTSTDGSGFVEALRAHGLTQCAKVLVLGAGGTARAVVGALGEISREVHVMGRSSAREDSIARCAQGRPFEYIRWRSDIDFSSYDLVVNTTPAGAADLCAEYIVRGSISVLFDVLYKPWPTVLARRWSDNGGKVISGLDLLLYQGIAQIELVLGETFDRAALAKELRIALISAR